MRQTELREAGERAREATAAALADTEEVGGPPEAAQAAQEATEANADANGGRDPAGPERGHQAAAEADDRAAAAHEAAGGAGNEAAARRHREAAAEQRAAAEAARVYREADERV
jgi:hypothetical protein